MKFIDMHCDTLSKLYFKHDDNLLNNDYTSVTLDRMKKAGQLAQFFAIWIPPRSEFEEEGFADVSDSKYVEDLKIILDENVKKNSDRIEHAYNLDDILKNEKNGKMSAILAVEDGRNIKGDLNRIKEYYDMGVRSLTLIWNNDNCFGFPNSADAEENARGLTHFGKEAIQYMQELGMLVDVSHLSDGGIFDCLDILDKPFVATHSNARSLTGHQRNLTDEMIKQMGKKGCISGVNFLPYFASLSKDDENRGLAINYAKHAKHMADKGGIEFVALGTDFDGIKGELEIKYSDDMYKLEYALKEVGFKSSEIEMMFYKNVERVFKDSVK